MKNSRPSTKIGVLFYTENQHLIHVIYRLKSSLTQSPVAKKTIYHQFQKSDKLRIELITEYLELTKTTKTRSVYVQRIQSMRCHGTG